MRHLSFLLAWLWFLSAAHAQTATYTGGNTLTLVVTSPRGQQTMTFSNLEGRMNTALEQFEFVASLSQSDLEAYADTVEVATRLTADEPISIVASFPGENINLEDFNGQPLTFPGEVRLAGQVFITPIHLEGIYRNNTLILDVSASVTEEGQRVAGSEVEELQLFGHGVRLINLTSQ